MLGIGLLVLLGWGAAVAGFDKRDVYVVVIVVLSGFLSWFRWLRENGRSCSVVINRRGVTLEHPKLSTRFVPWAAIGTARSSWLRGTFAVLSPEGQVVLTCPSSWMGGARIARRIARRIACQRDVYVRQNSGQKPFGGPDGMRSR